MTFEEKYAVIGTQDPQYEGSFITAVKTTGIFCRPSCRARKPKAENVEFMATTQEALRSGYRPCKVCKPMEPLDVTPPFIQSIINELHADPYLRLKDQDLRDRDIEPSQIRRWFQKHHNMTFHAYQRMIRLNRAYRDIKKGKSITETAYENGYDSLSGFQSGYQSIFGDAPSQTDKTVIHLKRFSTVLGPMYAAATDEGVCLVEFTDRRMLETEFKDLRKRLNAVILPGDHPLLDQVEQQLHEYFAGERMDFDIQLHAPGTDFQQSVWELLQQIPYGQTKSYKQQAIDIGNVKAIRAVATANGMNRIAIIIPCHRVLGSDGSLTGYAGGLERKRWLLDHERQHSHGVRQGELGL